MPDISRYLSIRSAGGGRLTADGFTLVFITNITGVPQAWSMPAAGGWPTQLTFADNRVGGVAPSPTDPDLVVFGRDDGGNERMQLHKVRPDGFGEEPLVVDPDVIHRFGEFGPDGTWFTFCDNRRNGVDFDLYIRTLDGTERLIAELDGWNVVVDVESGPDGDRALVGHFASNVDASVWVVDLDNGETTDLTPHEGQEYNAPVAFIEGGVALISDRDGEFRRAYLVKGDDWLPVGPDDADVDDLAVEGGDGVIAWNDGGRTRAAWLDPADGTLGAELDLPIGVAGGFEFGERVTFTLSGAAYPADVWAVDRQETSPVRVTTSSVAGIDPNSFVEPELVSVPSFDGLEVPAWVYRPTGDGSRPVVVSVHGGPEAQERPSFSSVYQYLVASGFVVVAPNVRGSAGYGKTYLSLDDRRKRMDSVADLEAIGRWVTDSGLGSGKPAVMGGSYGGFMVLAALANQPELWSAGVDIVGIANFVTFLENTGDYRRHLREAEYGYLAEDREFLTEISPLTNAHRITAPLLVIHGANDPRVPLGEAEQIVEAVSSNGGRVDLMVFDDEGHGIVKLANRKVAYSRVAEFLHEVLG